VGSIGVTLQAAERSPSVPTRVRVVDGVVVVAWQAYAVRL